MESETVTTFGSRPELPLMTTGPLWFVFVLLVLAGVWWWWWKRQRGLAPRSVSDLSIQILATRSLGPRSHLAIIEAAGHRSLIATTAQGVHHLRDLPKDDPAIAEVGFARHLEEKKENAPP